MLTEEQVRSAPPGSYMGDAQLEFFRNKLVEMRNEVLERQEAARRELGERHNFADPADRAAAEEERFLTLRLRDRENNLLSQIQKALRRMRDGEYGYCEETGDEIGIPRLLARPTASTAVELKEVLERRKAVYRKVA